MIRRKGLWALLLAATVAASGWWPAQPAQSASGGQSIRVALFIDIGKGYRGVVPDVTLTSEQGLEVRLTAQGTDVKVPWGSKTARFRVDEYSLLAAETADFRDAERIAQQLSQKKYDSSIVVEHRGGNMVYQVWSGSYATYAEAAAQAKAAGQAVGRTLSVKGPHRLEVGTFGSLREARDVEQVFEMSGLSAHTVILADGGRVSYAVWLGDEITPEGAVQLQQAARSVSSAYAYKPAETSKPYVVMKEEVAGMGVGELDTVPHFAFSPAAKVTVKPAKSASVPLITVEERSGRKYRGQFELSSYHGHLTVVNELPVEQYLYGVVGSEMASGWPLEALKAQAVLARTRAMGQGNKYGIAHLSDTVYEQAYYGYGREAEDIRRAVDQTAGEVIRYQGKLADSLYYSNAGGMSAAGREVWGRDVPYLSPVASDDTAPMRAAKLWYRVALSDGSFGYLRHDLVDLVADKHPLGFRMGIVNTDHVNFRTGPSTTYHKSTITLPAGATVTILGSEPEESAYLWSRGPYTSQEMTAILNASQARNNAPLFTAPIRELEVTKRGPSGRVMRVEADGMEVAASSPDAYRSVFRQGEQSLRSTKFEIEQMGSYSVLGAGGKRRTFPDDEPLFAIGAGGLDPFPANGGEDEFLIYRAADDWRVASHEPKFVIRGQGYGHGLGVSQFGAKAMAEKGYDYRQILTHYYRNVTIGP